LKENKHLNSLQFNSRAVFLVALAFFVSTTNGASTEIISRAQKLLLEKKRTEAIALLTSVPPTKTENIEALKEVAERFLTDKGQRSYELGLSQLPRNLAIAEKHFQAAQEMENGNLLVELGLIRNHIFQDQCQLARQRITGIKALQIISPTLVELELQIQWCLEDIQSIPSPRLSGALQKIHQAWLKWRNKEFDLAYKLAKDAIALEPKNPAVLFWLWKVQKDLNTSALATAEAFVDRCRSGDAEIRRRASSMIEFCLRSSEVESYLNSLGRDNQNATQ
jgi:hypothetical protein